MTNRFPGNCCKCAKRVAAGAGTAAKQSGAWVVYCSSCRPVEAAAPLPVGPTRILVTRLPSGEVRIAPSSFLGGDLFATYRLAVSGMRYDSSDKSQRSSDLALVGRALSRLQESGLLLDVAPEVGAALVSQVAQSASEVASADGRATAVDAVLKARGLALFPFQRIGTTWLAPRMGALLGDDMGLGKTIQALTALPEGCAALVVGPAVAKGVWLRECRKWRPDLTPIVLSGRGSFRWPAPGELVIINYDVLPAVVDNKNKPGARPTDAASWWKAFCKVWGKIGEAAAAAHILGSVPRGVILLSDEAHALKGGLKTQRGARFRALSKAVRDAGGRAWGLTATPLLNQPPELWAVLTAFGLEKEAFGSWPNFKRIGGGRDTRFGTEWDPAEMDKGALQAGLYRVMLRRMKVDVLKDLPAKTYSEIVVDIPAKVSKLCDAALAIIEARGQSAADALELANKQGSPAFETMSKARAALATAKLEACIELVEQFEDADEPVVVFSAHRAPIDVLGTRSGWAAITGETPPAERTRIEEAFQNGHLRGVALTIKAGGVAITLTRATNAIRIDKEWNPALNIQAEDRIYRIGTTKPVTITDLTADHPLDLRVAELLERKQAFLTNSVDAAVRGPTEVPTADAAADLDAAAAALAQAQADLEAQVAKQRAAAAARKAAQDARDAEEAPKRAKREADQKEGAARSRARQALARRAPAELTEDDLNDVRRGPVGEREEWAAQALTILAGTDSDHAAIKNFEGFNRADGRIGHDLAGRLDEGLVDCEWKLAVVLCQKYQATQVGACPGSPIDRAEKSAVA